MKLEFGNYILISKEGGIEIQKNGKLLYFNKRPMFVKVKTPLALTRFTTKLTRRPWFSTKVSLTIAESDDVSLLSLLRTLTMMVLLR